MSTSQAYAKDQLTNENQTKVTTLKEDADNNTSISSTGTLANASLSPSITVLEESNSKATDTKQTEDFLATLAKTKEDYLKKYRIGSYNLFTALAAKEKTKEKEKSIAPTMASATSNKEDLNNIAREKEKNDTNKHNHKIDFRLSDEWVLVKGDLTKLRDPKNLTEIIVFERKKVDIKDQKASFDIAANVSANTATSIDSNTSIVSATSITNSASSTINPNAVTTTEKDKKAEGDKPKAILIVFTRKMLEGLNALEAPIQMSILFESASLTLNRIGPFQSLHDQIALEIYGAEYYPSRNWGAAVGDFTQARNGLLMGFSFGSMSEPLATTCFDFLSKELCFSENDAIYFQSLTMDPKTDIERDKIDRIAEFVSNKQIDKYKRAIEIARELHTVNKQSIKLVGEEECDSATIAFELGLELAKDSIPHAIESFKIINSYSSLYRQALEQIAILYKLQSESVIDHTEEQCRENRWQSIRYYLFLSLSYSLKSDFNFNIQNLRAIMAEACSLIEKQAGLTARETNLFETFSLALNMLLQRHSTKKTDQTFEAFLNKLKLYSEILLNLANKIYLENKAHSLSSLSMTASAPTDVDKKVTIDMPNNPSMKYATIADTKNLVDNAASTANTNMAVLTSNDNPLDNFKPIHNRYALEKDSILLTITKPQAFKHKFITETKEKTEKEIADKEKGNKETQNKPILVRAVIFNKLIGYDSDTRGFLTSGHTVDTLILVFRVPVDSVNYKDKILNKLIATNLAISTTLENEISSEIYRTAEEDQIFNNTITLAFDIGDMNIKVRDDFLNTLKIEGLISKSEANLIKETAEYKPTEYNKEEWDMVQAMLDRGEYDLAIKETDNIHQRALAKYKTRYPYKTECDDTDMAYELGLALLKRELPVKAIKAFAIIKFNSVLYALAQEQISLIMQSFVEKPGFEVLSHTDRATRGLSYNARDDLEMLVRVTYSYLFAEILISSNYESKEAQTKETDAAVTSESPKKENPKFREIANSCLEYIKQFAGIEGDLQNDLITTVLFTDEEDKKINSKRENFFKIIGFSLIKPFTEIIWKLKKAPKNMANLRPSASIEEDAIRHIHIHANSPMERLAAIQEASAATNQTLTPASVSPLTYSNAATSATGQSVTTASGAGISSDLSTLAPITSTEVSIGTATSVTGGKLSSY